MDVSRRQISWATTSIVVAEERLVRGYGSRVDLRVCFVDGQPLRGSVEAAVVFDLQREDRVSIHCERDTSGGILSNQEPLAAGAAIGQQARVEASTLGDKCSNGGCEVLSELARLNLQVGGRHGSRR